jgi:hypothetical protein
MKLFQIEEPDGGPADPSAPGAAIGVDTGGEIAEVAVSVGGNAVLLADREGFERALAVPGAEAAPAQWQELFEMARVRAERALSRPVTHAVIVLDVEADSELSEKLQDAAEAAGLNVLRVLCTAELPAGATAVLASAVLAEELAPRPE